jgi:hypothetical protein
MMQKRGRMTYRSVKRAGSCFVGVKAYHTRIFQSWTSSQPKLGPISPVEGPARCKWHLGPCRRTAHHPCDLLLGLESWEHAQIRALRRHQICLGGNFMPAEPIRCRRPIKYQRILRGKIRKWEAMPTFRAHDDLRRVRTALRVIGTRPRCPSMYILSLDYATGRLKKKKKRLQGSCRS